MAPVSSVRGVQAEAGLAPGYSGSNASSPLSPFRRSNRSQYFSERFAPLAAEMRTENVWEPARGYFMDTEWEIKTKMNRSCPYESLACQASPSVLA